MKNDERMIASTDLLKTFVVIAECRNLTAASAKLNRTQSAVSVQLRKLEDQLGVSLFERQARGMVLTENGEQLFPAARQALDAVRRASTLFDAPLSGLLRVGIPDDFDDTIFERVLAEFTLRNPDVRIDAMSGCTSGYLDAVRRGELDIAVCSAPHQVDGDLLTVDPTVWVCAESWSPDPDTPIPLAILDRACWWRTLPSDTLDREGRAWRVAYKSASFASVRSAIRAGLAVGVVPMRSVEAGLQILSAEHGMPALPSSTRSLVIRNGAPPELTAAMATAIRRAVAQH